MRANFKHLRVLNPSTVQGPVCNYLDLIPAIANLEYLEGTRRRLAFAC